jgi:hypothetical protein
VGGVEKLDAQGGLLNYTMARLAREIVKRARRPKALDARNQFLWTSGPIASRSATRFDPPFADAQSKNCDRCQADGEAAI